MLVLSTNSATALMTSHIPQALRTRLKAAGVEELKAMGTEFVRLAEAGTEAEEGWPHTTYVPCAHAMHVCGQAWVGICLSAPLFVYPSLSLSPHLSNHPPLSLSLATLTSANLSC
jgi:hypothetical protein